MSTLPTGPTDRPLLTFQLLQPYGFNCRRHEQVRHCLSSSISPHKALTAPTLRLEGKGRTKEQHSRDDGDLGQHDQVCKPSKPPDHPKAGSAKIPESEFSTLPNGLKHYDIMVGTRPKAVKRSHLNL
ncbi:hypothetical protein E2562_026084 [Oryza meyeriana var. granulata]|uniref:Uncharacterized protein n=1 Tax=Oryza meyeriana var. granulata TaxID=110450 RepID=A0A6G1EYZ5_9ORYZ|nr:hypothetical protein E2562_026084 [Oryza meyeriana var. granulata]